MPATDPAELAELDNRIAILRGNLRELVEQAAAYSGAADESRTADRIADQQAKLDALIAERGRNGYFHYNAIVAWEVNEDGKVTHVYA